MQSTVRRCRADTHNQDTPAADVKSLNDSPILETRAPRSVLLLTLGKNAVKSCLERFSCRLQGMSSSECVSPVQVERPDPEEQQGEPVAHESNWSEGLISGIKDGLFSWLPPLSSQAPSQSYANAAAPPAPQWPDRLPRQAVSKLEGAENQGPFLLVLPGAAEQCEGAVLQVAAVLRHCLTALRLEGPREDVQVCTCAPVIVIFCKFLRQFLSFAFSS